MIRSLLGTTAHADLVATRDKLLAERGEKLSGKLSFRADPSFHFEQFKVTDALTGLELE